MRKATGKVVSLVLALALVVTSFSSTFAFAATKTESGEASSIDDVYLVNLNGLEGENLAAAKAANRDKFNITDYVAGETLETYDHIVLDDIDIYSVSVSGDNIIRVTKNDDDEYIATVRDTKGTGKATVNVLFTGTTTLRGDEEITVRGSSKFTVTLLDAKTPILGDAGAESKAAGEGVDSVSALQKNPQYVDSAYETVVEEKVVTTAEAQVYLPVADTNSAMAKYVAQDLQQAVTSGDKIYETDAYIVSASGTNNYLKVSGDTITYGVANPAVGNSVRLSVYSTKETTVEEKTKYTNNKTVGQATVKVENRVVGDFTEVAVGDGEKDSDKVNMKENVVRSKSKTYVKLADGWWDVTGGDVESTNAGLVTVSGGKIGALTAASVTVEDGTVGDIEAATANIYGGTTGDVDADDVTVDGATVASVSDATNVTVNSGKVTGAVSGTTVTLDPTSDEDEVSVGAVTAKTLTVNGMLGKASAAGFTANAAEAALSVKGENATIGAIDFDYYSGTVNLVDFVGTVPAPAKATYTGYSETGVNLKSETEDSDNETKATVSGNLAIYTIELNAGSVTFAGNVKVNNVYGGEADMIINAGALNITESVATSNTLKIADAADVAAGTVVYTAASDIADENSFIGYGYTVKKVSGSSTDAFVIDSISFAGLTMNKTEAEILLGTSETFTASVYPNGTTMPEGAYIKFFLDGDENYISGVDNGNGTATIEAKKYDSDFDVLNKATLTAQVYDQYDIQLEEYGEATCAITVIEKPKTTYVSDTTGNVNVVAGGTYQFKITSTDGSVPQFAVAGDGSIFKLVAQSNEGNDYFFKVQAVGTVGQVCGVYVNKEATPVATLTVAADYACDTTAVNVAVGATYQVKITANSMPTLAAGNSIYSVAFASQSGNDYFFKITATQNAKAGDVVGFYINGAPSAAFVATTV
ncbi:MAG: hypothetical protein DBX51_03520 [Clostridiales bacterium]|nr:MAG: hypothetical protein DBX51_03520 [Clostridiales bacterium]